MRAIFSLKTPFLVSGFRRQRFYLGSNLRPSSAELSAPVIWHLKFHAPHGSFLQHSRPPLRKSAVLRSTCRVMQPGSFQDSIPDSHRKSTVSVLQYPSPTGPLERWKPCCSARCRAVHYSSGMGLHVTMLSMAPDAVDVIQYLRELGPIDNSRSHLLRRTTYKDGHERPYFAQSRLQ